MLRTAKPAPAESTASPYASKSAYPNPPGSQGPAAEHAAATWSRSVVVGDSKNQRIRQQPGQQQPGHRRRWLQPGRHNALAHQGRRAADRVHRKRDRRYWSADCPAGDGRAPRPGRPRPARPRPAPASLWSTRIMRSRGGLSTSGERPLPKYLPSSSRHKEVVALVAQHPRPPVAHPHGQANRGTSASIASWHATDSTRDTETLSRSSRSSICCDRNQRRCRR